MSGGLPPDPHKPSPQNLAWAPHFTRARHQARGDPKCWTPRLPPIVTPSEKPWRVKNWKGASKQKLLLGVGLPDKIYFRGAHPNPGAAGSTPPKGVFALRILRGPANKSCSSGWVCSVKFYLWGLTPTLGPQGPPFQEGVFAFEQFPWNLSCASHFTWPQW